MTSTDDPQREAQTRPVVSPGGCPCLTLLVCGLAAGLYFWSGALDALAYERTRIAAGQVWRLFTGHFVHFSGSHLLWNLVVLAGTGVWLERRNRRALGITLAAAPWAISAALWFFRPDLQLYAGVSGVASGVLVALALDGLRRDGGHRSGWAILLAVFVAKVAFDAISGRPLNPELANKGVAAVPLAHAVGGLVGGIALLFRRK